MRGWLLALMPPGAQGERACAALEGQHGFEKKLVADGFAAFYTPLPQFPDDKIFHEDASSFFLLDGAIFNMEEFLHPGEAWVSCAASLYHQQPDAFLNRLRGSFCGAGYDKQNRRLSVFTDHTCSKNAFYAMDDTGTVIAAASNFGFLCSWLKQAGSLAFDLRASEYMLSYGYMLDDSTYCRQVKRVYPGHLVQADEKGARQICYHAFDNRNTEEKTDEEWILLLEQAFEQAVRRQFGRDCAYGYRHLIDISGGLDSRMTAFVAHRLGYKNTLYLCYSQTGAPDETIARRIVSLLGGKLAFYPLDDAAFIYDTDELVQMNGGLTYFASITGGKRLLAACMRDGCGMQHTGILGDMDEGTFATVPYHTPPVSEERYRFTGLLDIPVHRSVFEGFANNEMCWFFLRGMMAGFSTNLIRHQYTESFSPFADVDFLELFFRIPLQTRTTGKIFKKWMIAQYPQAAGIPYAKYGLPITAPDALVQSWLRLRYQWRVRLPRLLGRMGIGGQKASRRGMNPFGYWYESNPALRGYIQSYFSENIGRSAGIPVLRARLGRLQREGGVFDLLAGMTVLSVLKNYFED